MALTVQTNTTRIIGIEEYVDHVQAEVRLSDYDSLAASASALRELANDRTVVVKKLNERIEDFLTDGAIPSSQSILLGRGKGFYVRASIWPAINEIANGGAYQDQLAYNLAHDHNFTFLTVNHLGAGYETEIYEYDYESVQGYIGERVALRFLEKIRFGGGAVMLYRANKDVHVQYAPQELTITLNLMVAPETVLMRDQFFFDLSTCTIASYPAEIATSRRASFVTLAGFLGDADTRQLLDDLAVSHPCRRTRLAAVEALCRQDPKAAERTLRRAADDPSTIVATAARNKLRALTDA